MRAEIISKYGPLGAARKSACLTQEEMGKILGKSTSTILSYEKEPDAVPVGVLAKIHKTVGIDGQQIINDYLIATFS